MRKTGVYLFVPQLPTTRSLLKLCQVVNLNCCERLDHVLQVVLSSKGSVNIMVEFHGEVKGMWRAMVVRSGERKETL